MEEAIYFDMDGTIADLYGVPDWLPKLRAEDSTPYLEAKPRVDLIELSNILYQLKNKGYRIGVISWLSKDSSQAYKQAVREAKAQWLKENVPVIFEEIHLIQYGYPKHYVAHYKQGTLVDDDVNVRTAWERRGGQTIDANQDDWLTQLRKLL